MNTLSRNQLYDLVWAKSMTKVAAKFDITGTALKKTCARHKIPTPERGYWAKLAHGKTVRQLPLPALDDRRLQTIRIGHGYKAQVPETIQKAVAEARKRAVGHENAPPIAATLPVSEPASLAATRRAMSKARADSEGYVNGGGKGVVGFQVDAASIEHALEVLAQLFACVEARGFVPKVTDDGLALLVDGEAITFSITEQSLKTPHLPTPKELQRMADHERSGYGSSTPWPKYDYSPSGRVAIVIAGNEYSGLRRTYSERKTTGIDSILPDLLISLAEHAAYTKERRREAEERQEAQRQEELRRKTEAAYAALEERREKFVEAIARQLERRDRLSRVLAHLEQIRSEESDRPKGLADWLRRRIQQIDALVSLDFLDLSGRSAKVEFGRNASEDSDQASYLFRPSEIELRLWDIDKVEGVGRARSQREWEEMAELCQPKPPTTS